MVRARAKHSLARSSIGKGYCPFKAERWVRFPYGLLQRDEKLRAEVQMEARLLWEQEVFGSTPRRPADAVVEDWLSGWP
jgi:hypothetical protein